MHELSIATALLELCEERFEARGARTLARVRIAVGELSSVDPRLLRHAFEALVAGTELGNPELEIDWRPARQSCVLCGEVEDKQPGSWLRLCPACGLPLAVAGGDELDLLGIETGEEVLR